LPTAQAIKSGDSLGTNGSKFFPIGIWYDAHRAQWGYLDACAEYNDQGGIPETPADQIKYYEETLSQLKAWGINSIVDVNANCTTVPSDVSLCNRRAPPPTLYQVWTCPITADSAINLLDVADKVGVYVIHEPSKFHDIAWTCSATSIDTVASSVAATFSNKPALLWYQITDEPHDPACLLVDRQLYSTLRAHDSSHSGFAAISDINNHSEASDIDRLLGLDLLSYDDYPLFVINATNPVPALEAWANRVDYYYQLTPADKPLLPVLQTQSHNDSLSVYGYRFATPIELRFMTYSALARGAKGILYYLYQTFQVYARGVADFDFNQNSTGRELQKLASELRLLAPWLVDASRDMLSKNGRFTVATVTNTGFGDNDYDLTSLQTIFGEKLLMLVNERVAPLAAGEEPSTQYHVHVDLSGPEMQAICTKGQLTARNVLTGQVYGTIATCASSFDFNITLTKGDGALIQLQSALSADIRIPRDSYNNPVNAGKSVSIAVTLKNMGSTTWDVTNHHVGVRVYAPDGTTSDAVGLSGNNFTSNVVPGASVRLTLNVPTGPGTSLPVVGPYGLGVDLFQDGTPTTWFQNQQEITVMVVPGPTLVDTFDSVPVTRPPDALARWDLRPTALLTTRADTLAMTGQGVVLGKASALTDSIFQFDVMIDPESSPDTEFAGWVVRASDTNNDGFIDTGYMFQLAGSTASVTRNSLRRHTVSGGTFTWQGSTTVSQPIVKGVWYHVIQELTGSTLKTYLKPLHDPHPAVLVDTWTNRTYSSGTVGFRLNEAPPDDLERAHYDNAVFFDTVLDGTAPQQPSDVTVTGTSDKLSVSWARSTQPIVSHYRVYRGTTPAAKVLVAEPAGPNYVDSAVTPGTRYYYKVTAVSHAGVESSKSPAVRGTPVAIPEIVTGLTAVADNMKTVTLSWSGSAAKYNIHRLRAPPFVGIVPSEANRIATVTTTSFQDAVTNTYVSDAQLGLTGFATYYYAVVPVSSTNGLGPSAAVTITTPGSAVFADGFDGTAAQWEPYLGFGTWSVSGSAYNQTTANCGPGCIIPAESTISNRIWRDLIAEFTVQINTYGGNNANWVGMTIRKTLSWHRFGSSYYSGHLIYYRANGKIELYNGRTGTVVATADTGLLPTVKGGGPRRVRIEANNRSIRVLVDGTKFIDWEDIVAGSAGFVDLTTYGVTASYWDVNIFYRDNFNRCSSFTTASRCDSAPSWQTLPVNAAPTLANTGQLTLAPGPGILHWTTPRDLQVTNFTADFAIRIDNAGDQTLWGGFTFRKQTPTSDTFSSGYTVYYRSNGQLELYDSTVGVIYVASAPIPNVYRNVRVTTVGNRIRVWVDGIQKIDWTDAGSHYSWGYVHLSSYGTTSRFQFIQIY
jgi:hypothetical protein